MTAGDILTAGRTGVEVPRQLTAGLYIAPDSGGDECVWCDDPARPGWPEHLVWRGQVGERVWAVRGPASEERSVSEGVRRLADSLEGEVMRRGVEEFERFAREDGYTLDVAFMSTFRLGLIAGHSVCLEVLQERGLLDSAAIRREVSS